MIVELRIGLDNCSRNWSKCWLRRRRIGGVGYRVTHDISMIEHLQKSHRKRVVVDNVEEENSGGTVTLERDERGEDTSLAEPSEQLSDGTVLSFREDRRCLDRRE